MEKREHSPGIAIIGMACRYPGADNIIAFWGEHPVQDKIFFWLAHYESLSLLSSPIRAII